MAQLDMLFKKQFGVVDAHPMAPFSVEPVVSSRPSVMADQQLWAQSVPTTAPTDLVSATFTNPGVAGGTKQTSTAKSYIAKYTGCALATGVNGTSSGVSYTFSGTTNYLTDVIPFNYDPMGGYTVSVSVGGINTLMTDATNPWVLDADAGYLIFLGAAAIPISTPVLITYWRYEGTKGYTIPTYGDAWVSQYLIGIPPAITAPSVTRTSTDIFVTWTNPTQTSFAFTPNKLPALNDFFARMNTTTIPTAGAIVAATASPAITGLKVSWMPDAVGESSGSSLVLSATPPGGSATQMLCYYDSTLNVAGNFGTNTTNAVTVYYSNVSGSTTATPILIGAFLTPGTPAAPGGGIVTNATTTIGFSYTAPVAEVGASPPSRMAITGYTVTYYSTGSTARSGSLLNDRTSGSPYSVSNGTALSYTASSLFPDAPYTFNVKATNSYGNTSATALTVTRTTSNLPPLVSPLSGSLTLPAVFYTGGAYAVSDTTKATPITNLVSAALLTAISLLFNVPIQQVASRGTLCNTTTNAMMLSCALMNNGATTWAGPSLAFKGYASTPPSAGTASNLTLTPGTIQDSYASQALQNRGFYTDVPGTFSVDTAALKALSSPSLYTLSLSQTFPGTGDSTTYSASQSFYVDGVTSAPSLTTPTIAIAGSAVTGDVSGLKVLRTTDITVTYTPGNLGKYFYVSPASGVAQITGANLTTKTLTSPDATWISAGQFKATLPSTQTAVTGAASPTYATSLAATVTLTNSFGSTSAASATLNVIVDPAAYALAWTPTVAPNGALGAHVLSPSTPNSPTVPFPIASYDSAQRIVGNSGATAQYNNELQVVNGAFLTPPEGGYANYSDLYNTLNYSSPSSLNGYRYATFVWQLSSAGSTLTLSLVSPSGLTVSALQTALMGGQPLQLFYCFQEASTGSTPAIGNYSTTWINGNSNTAATFVTSGNYNTTGRSGLQSCTSSGAFSVKVPFQAQSGSYLYCVVGLPMSVACSFRGVTATLTI